MQLVVPVVSRSGNAQMSDIPDSGPQTPLASSPDMHTQKATQPGPGGGDRDEDNILVDYIVEFPGVRRVTSMGTLPDTFMVNNEGLPLKKVKLPNIF